MLVAAGRKFVKLVIKKATHYVWPLEIGNFLAYAPRRVMILLMEPRSDSSSSDKPELQPCLYGNTFRTATNRMRPESFVS